jgi:hypothetical protein
MGAARLPYLGHRVTCVDEGEECVADLKSGCLPGYGLRPKEAVERSVV